MCCLLLLVLPLRLRGAASPILRTEDGKTAQILIVHDTNATEASSQTQSAFVAWLCKGSRI